MRSELTRAEVEAAVQGLYASVAFSREQLVAIWPLVRLAERALAQRAASEDEVCYEAEERWKRDAGGYSVLTAYELGVRDTEARLLLLPGERGGG